MTTGNFVMFDAAKLKSLATLRLGSDAMHAILCNGSQALAEAFTGLSGDCRYSDLTGELATASGYTVGGAALTGVTLTSGPFVPWAADTTGWTITGTITPKYVVIVDWSAPNQDLIAFVDLSTGGGTISVGPDAFNVSLNPILNLLREIAP